MSFIAWFTETSNSLIANYSYLGILFVSFLGASTIILPTPAYIIIFLAAAKLNPLLVGIFGGLGAALGELTGYAVGFGGGKVIEKKWKKEIKKWGARFQKYGGFVLVVLFAATPLPDDIIGVLCGTIKYNIKKFFIASLIGKVIIHLLIAYAGYYSINWILDVFGLSL